MAATATTSVETTRAGRTGERVQLGRYRTPHGERLLIGQRILGVVRVSDAPATGRGRRYLIEHEQTTKARA